MAARPQKGPTAAEGQGVKYWRRVAPERNNPQEVAAAQLRLADEIIGNTVAKKLEVRGLVFP